MENPSIQDGEISVWLIPQTEIEETKKDNKNRIVWVLSFILLYISFILCITYFSYSLPSSPFFAKNSELAKWTDIWPWSTFVLWIICMVAGYSFVAVITEKRGHPFKSRFDKYQCTLRMVVKAPLVFLCGPIRSLHNPAESDQFQAFLYNSIFVIFFFVGLQFTYLDGIMLFRRAGDKFGSPSLWKTYTRSELALIIPIILVIVGSIVWECYLIFFDSLAIWYLILYGIIFAAIILPTIILRNSHHLHMHHYAIFGLLIPFFAFPNPFSMGWLGVVSGIYVEGVSRWGMAWFWYPGAQREY